MHRVLNEIEIMLPLLLHPRIYHSITTFVTNDWSRVHTYMLICITISIKESFVSNYRGKAILSRERAGEEVQTTVG